MSAEEFIPIVITLGLFLLIFGLRYLANKERMAMIERGITLLQRRADPLLPMRAGLLMLGSGIGLMLAFLLDHSMFNNENNDLEPLYFGFIFIFGGAALFLAYLLEKKNNDRQQKSE